MTTAPAAPQLVEVDPLERVAGAVDELEVRVRQLEAEVSEQRTLTGLLVRELADVRAVTLRDEGNVPE